MLNYFRLMIKKELFFVLVLCLFIFLSSKALFHKGFFRTIDDITTMRIVYMGKELERGNWLNNFPVRMSGELSNNYGYPLYLFYSPLIYYAGAFLMMVFSVSHIVATKYVYVFPLIFGPLAFYFAARQKVERLPALAASVIFTLFPYRGTNTYLRGAAPEAWAIAFIPLAFSGIFLIQKNKKVGELIFAFSFFLIIVSHNLTGMLFLGFILVYGLLFFLNNRDFWKYLVLGLSMSAFFWLPMIFYLKIIRVTTLDINRTYLLQTLEPIQKLWTVSIYQMVWRVSGIFFYLLIFGLAFFILKKKNGEKGLKEIFFWGISGFVLYLLLFDPFTAIWKLTLPITGILQFAWRILSLLVFIIPLFFGLLLAAVKNSFLKYVLVAVAVFASLNFLPSFKPEQYSFFYEYKPEGPCATTSWQDEFLPLWVNGCPPSKDPLETLPKSKVDLIGSDALLLKANTNLESDGQLTVNKFYFPGWHVFVDGKDSALNWNFSIDGIFRTPLSAGRHDITVVYRKTLVMWVADFISLISFGLFFYFLWQWKFEKGWVKNKNHK